MNKKQSNNNLKNHAYNAVKKATREQSAESGRGQNSPQQKSKAPSRPPHTGVIIKRGL